jgi:enoyl-CoA hydratase/carnithine racemase
MLSRLRLAPLVRPWTRSFSTPSTWREVRLSTCGPRADLTLVRPAARNALSLSLMKELSAACAWINTQEKDVRVVVLQGEGEAFCAGMDTSEDVSAEALQLGELGYATAAALESLNAITIASLHGHVVGGGMVLVSACDLRVASEDAYFTLPEVALGVPLTWGGLHRMMMDLGAAKVKELVITGRPMPASEALACGFINAVAASVDERDVIVGRLADKISSRPRHAVTQTKRGVNSIASQMVGLESARFSDAAILAAGLQDAEGKEARERHLLSLVKHRSGSHRSHA